MKRLIRTLKTYYTYFPAQLLVWSIVVRLDWKIFTNALKFNIAWFFKVDCWYAWRKFIKSIVRKYATLTHNDDLYISTLILP